MYARVGMRCPWSPEVSALLKLEQQAAVSHPRWVLELDLGCSGRAGHLLNSCFVSPDPLRIFYFIVLFYLYVCVMYSV